MMPSRRISEPSRKGAPGIFLYPFAITCAVSECQSLSVSQPCPTLRIPPNPGENGTNGQACGSPHNLEVAGSNPVPATFCKTC